MARRRKPEPYRIQPAVKAPLLLRLVVLSIPLALGAVFVVTAIEGSHRRRLPQPPSVRVTGLPPTKLRAPGHGTPHPGTHTSFAFPAWVPFAVLALVLAGGVAIVLVARLRARPAPTDQAPLRAAAGRLLGDAVELSLDDLRADPDQRRAVIAVYARMEAALAAAGLPRRRAEAPREYMGRVLGSLKLSAGPLQTLTVLFERAKFSIGRLDAGTRDRAIAALLALRKELV